MLAPAYRGFAVSRWPSPRHPHAGCRGNRSLTSGTSPGRRRSALAGRHPRRDGRPCTRRAAAGSAPGPFGRTAPVRRPVGSVSATVDRSSDPASAPRVALSEDLAIRTGDAKRKSAVSAFVIHATACDWKHSQASPTTTRAQQITHGRRLYRNTASSLLGVTRAGQVIADSCRHRCGEMLNVAVSAIPAPRCCA
jgi:hypothetical protein